MEEENQIQRKKPKLYLGVHKKVLDKFQSGSVTSIISAGYYGHRVGPLLLVNTADVKDRQNAYISSVHHKTIAQVTEEDIRSAGLNSFDELVDVLGRLEPSQGGWKGEFISYGTVVTVCNIVCG